MKASPLSVSIVTLTLILFIGCSDDDDPVAPGGGGTPETAFDTSTMPITVPGTPSVAANMAFDGSGNLLLAGDGGFVHRVSRSSGAITELANSIGGSIRLMCCVWDPGAQRIYVGTAISPSDTRIYSVNPSDGSSVLLVGLGSSGWTQQLLMAPSGFGGFGAFGGQLLLLTFGAGGLIAINPANPGSTTTLTAQTGTDMEFAPDGTLYVTDSSNDRVITIAADGQVTEFVGGIVNAEGIAINRGGSKMWVASTGATDQFYEVTIPGAVATPLTNVELSAGTFPTGMVHDGFGNLLYVGGTNTQFIDFVSVSN